MEFIRPYRRTGQLNQVEQWKLERDPLDVEQAVRARYAAEGPESIDEVPGEAERLKWVGLYPQRQGGNAFMLRVKVPGGRLTAAQARRIGEIADEHARPAGDPVGRSTLWGDGFCDLTTRQDVQLHWIRIEAVPEIWDRLTEVGLTTVQACGDSARNVLCCPVSGLDADEAFDALPVAEAISAFFTGNREYANLPRKFKMSVTGCLDDCAQAEINDIGLWPARLAGVGAPGSGATTSSRTTVEPGAGGTLGFNVLVGGGLSDGPRMASDIDVFVRPDQAVELTRAAAQLFGELGNRENRGLSRMRYLVQELGPEEFRRELATRIAFPLTPAGEELTRRYRGDHVGVHPQRQPRLSYVGCSVTVGRLAGRDLAAAADLAERYGAGEIRLATDQNFIITGVPNERVDDLLEEDLLSRHSPFPRPFERGVVACTGSEFCRFAIVETKERAVLWAREMDRRFAERLDGAGSDSGIIRMHLSGCPASCAQPQIADIGFRGETAHVGDRIVEAVDIAVGGSLGADAAFADFAGGAVPADDVPETLTRLLGRYEGERRSGERFHEWARRTGIDDLRQTVGRGVGQ